MSSSSINQPNSIKNTIVLFSCNLLQGFGQGMIFVILQPFLLTKIQSEAVLGILMSILYLSQYSIMPITGKLSDYWGRKPFILLGLFCILLGYFILALNPMFSLVIIGSFLVYLGWGIRDPPNQSLINESAPFNGHGRYFGLMFVGFFGGNIGGSLLINLVNDRFPVQTFFIIFIIIVGLQIIFLFIFLHHRPYKYNMIDYLEIHRRIARPITQGWLSQWKAYLTNEKLRKMIIFFLIDGMIWGIGIGIYNGAVSAEYDLSNRVLAMIVMLYNIGIVGIQIPAGKIIDKIGKKRGIILAEISGIIFYSMNILAWILQDQFLLPLLYSSQIFYGFAIAFYIPAQVVLFTNIDKESSAENYGIGFLLTGISFIPGTLIAGFLIEHLHYIVPFIVVLTAIPLELLYLRFKVEYIQ